MELLNGSFKFLDFPKKKKLKKKKKKRKEKKTILDFLGVFSPWVSISMGERVNANTTAKPLTRISKKGVDDTQGQYETGDYYAPMVYA